MFPHCLPREMPVFGYLTGVASGSTSQPPQILSTKYRSSAFGELSPNSQPSTQNPVPAKHVLDSDRGAGIQSAFSNNQLQKPASQMGHCKMTLWTKAMLRDKSSL